MKSKKIAEHQGVNIYQYTTDPTDSEFDQVKHAIYNITNHLYSYFSEKDEFTHCDWMARNAMDSELLNIYVLFAKNEKAKITNQGSITLFPYSRKSLKKALNELANQLPDCLCLNKAIAFFQLNCKFNRKL